MFVTAGTLALVALASTAAAHGSHGLIDMALLESRGPIEIMGDHDFTPANGVRSGSGTPADPYVISNWRIEGSGEFAIEICDATVSWVIRNVLIDELLVSVTDGIWLANVTGGVIEHVDVRGAAKYGVYIEHSDGTVLRESVLSLNRYIGAYAHESHNMLWDNNRVTNNFRHGLYLANGSSFNAIRNNFASRHLGYGSYSFGIYSGIGANDNVIERNTVTENGVGIQVNEVTRNFIRDNTATANERRGISLSLTTDTVVEGNLVLDDGARGILLGQSERNTVRGNTIEGEGSPAGIEISDLGNNVVHGNVVRHRAIGIRILNLSNGNLIYDNFFSNDRNADDATGRSLWNVSKRPGPNVVGGPFIAGNYWSDLTDEIHDHDEDGLGEAHGPYADGILLGGDYLPITKALDAPRAAFEISNEYPATREVVRFLDASIPGRAVIRNWTWDFGDGGRAWGKSVEHRYLSSGDYRVVLRVRDIDGLVSLSSRILQVRNAPPVPVVAGAPEILSREAEVRFDGSASHDPDGFVLVHQWDFGDGTTATGADVSHTYAADGLYSAGLQVTDNRLASSMLPFRVVVDREPPLTAAVLSGERGSSGWFVEPATLDFAATDATSGVARTEADAGGGLLAVGGGLRIGEGDREIRYRSVDRAGNEEAPRSVRVRVDLSPPGTTLSGPAFANDSARFTLSATDSASGVRRTFFRLPGDGEWRVYERPFTLAGLPEGPVEIRFRSEDVAGWEEETRSVTVLLDRTPPAVAFESPAPRSLTALGRETVAPQPPPMRATFEPESPANAAFVVGAVEVRVASGDHGAGVAWVRVLLDGAPLFEGPPGLAWTWNSHESRLGPHVLTAWAIDQAGNAAETRRTVYVL